jgi:hypothetical protein
MAKDELVDAEAGTVTTSNQYTHWLKRIASILHFLQYFLYCFCIILLLFFCTHLGIGKSFPVQPMQSMAPLLDESVLEVVAILNTPPGNLAVNKDNRVFFTFHPSYKPYPTKIAELVNQTHWIPYPSLEFQKSIISCLSIRIDVKNKLWILDFAEHGFKGKPTLTSIDIATSKVLSKYTFPHAVAGIGSMLNDFNVDPSGKYIYIADTNIVGMNPAIIVYSIDSNKAYRTLTELPSLYGDSYFLNINGYKYGLGPFGVKVHVDSIAVDRKGDHLYFGAVTSNKLYSISTSYLLSYASYKHYDHRSRHLTKQKINENILMVTHLKPQSDGITTDALENVLITSIEHSAIAVMQQRIVLDEVNGRQASHNVVKLVESSKYLQWPDGLSFGPDALYISNSHLHRLIPEMVLNSRDLTRKGPFHIVKIDQNFLAQVGIKMPAPGQ